jgi:hypothetical protein
MVETVIASLVTCRGVVTTNVREASGISLVPLAANPLLAFNGVFLAYWNVLAFGYRVALWPLRIDLLDKVV